MRVEAKPSAAATELLVDGMNCNNCARKVTTALQGVPGVHSVTISLEARRAAARWETGTPPEPARLVAALQAAGYPATVIEARPPGGPEAKPSPNWHWNLWLGGFVTGLLMMDEWGFGVGDERRYQWLAFTLAGVVQIVCGAAFYRGAWRQLRAGSANMDTLVALGSTTAFGYSVWALLGGHGGHVYFLEAAAIITLISLGHWLEARASARASDALKDLLRLAPATALKKEFDGTETEVPVATLQPGDHVILAPGDHVPVDGVVAEGSSSVDEAMLTGESMPVNKPLDSELFAGTVNLDGRLLMRVTATGEATALAHIIAAVQRAQSSRADIQRLGDRISNVFVPGVVVLALAAGFGWGLAPAALGKFHAALAPFLWAAHVPAGTAAGFIVAAAVLIVACPCAMGLATPAAIMAGANAAARRGILIRDGVALEKAGAVTAVVFDKTGTLTHGRPAVAAARSLFSLPTPFIEGQALGEERMKDIAAAIARPSAHPVSRALAGLAEEEVIFTDWREWRGAGVEGKFNLASCVKTARLGSLRWLREQGVDLAAGEAFTAEWTARGATVVGLALDHSLCGLFALKDTLKPGAADVVKALQRQGLQTYLLTGDNAPTAASIAREAGIAAENVFAEVRPEQKAATVKQLQAAGGRVAFVGDGINDAPALTQANLGIAVSRASDVAREAADIILLKSEIEAVPEALGLARATLRTIKQNLFWAFFYNALGVPLAALGFMSPVLCAAAMGVSDLIVIGNALRLARWKK
jgi:P-type Cu+ transporter